MADQSQEPSSADPVGPTPARPPSAGSPSAGSPSAGPPPARPTESEAVARRRRQRRLAEVFGDVLPDQTSDDTDPPEPEDAGEEWLRRQVPPHHG